MTTNEHSEPSEPTPDAEQASFLSLAAGFLAALAVLSFSTGTNARVFEIIGGGAATIVGIAAIVLARVHRRPINTLIGVAATVIGVAVLVISIWTLSQP